MELDANRSDFIELHGSCLFVSDAHFHTPQNLDSQLREEFFLQLLDEYNSIDHLFFLGDIFDFWFEYKDVAPKGYFRLFNALYEKNKQGTKIHFFSGNHDMWVRDYFIKSFDAKIYRKEQKFLINNNKFLIAHGDGLGGKQRRYNLIKKIFNFKPNQFLYSILHPIFAFSIARFFSKQSRNSHNEDDLIFKSESEFQIRYARNILKLQHFDFFIFGHRHIPIKYNLSDSSTFFNTGDWIKKYSYVIYNSNDISPKLEFFKPKQ